MEIFTEEFKGLLSKQLDELSNVVKTNNSKQMSDYEIAKAMKDCIDCYEEELKLKKEKKKKKNQFEVGDVVYFGTKKGEVISLSKEISDSGVTTGIVVSFCESRKYDFYGFKNDGSVFEGQEIFLSHYPYKLKMKKIKK